MLDRIARDIQYYDRYIDEYPDTKVIHLEPLYMIVRCLAVLDYPFLKTLLGLGGWRGRSAGGLIALLRPNGDWRGLLSPNPEYSYLDSEWSCDCACAELSNREWEPIYQGLIRPINVIREAVNRLQFPQTPIRRQMTKSECQQFESLRDRIRKPYLQQGLGAARKVLRSSPVYEWTLSYDRWAKEYGNSEESVAQYTVRGHA